MPWFADAHNHGREAVEGFDIAEVGLFEVGYLTPGPVLASVDRSADLSVAAAGPHDALVGGGEAAQGGFGAGSQDPDGLGLDVVDADHQQECLDQGSHGWKL